jgi:hypothetical protein
MSRSRSGEIVGHAGGQCISPVGWPNWRMKTLNPLRLLETSYRLWDNLNNKRMYLTAYRAFSSQRGVHHRLRSTHETASRNLRHHRLRCGITLAAVSRRKKKEKGKGDETFAGGAVTTAF